MKKLLIALILLTVVISAHGQNNSVKINGLAMLAGTVNAGYEKGITRNISVGADLYYSPLQSGNFCLKGYMISGGFKYWSMGSFVGLFISSHILYSDFSVGGKTFISNGTLFGGGLSIGYYWPVTTRINIGAEIGAGVFVTKYHRSLRHAPDDSDIRIENHRRIIFSPSKCELSLSYLF